MPTLCRSHGLGTARLGTACPAVAGALALLLSLPAAGFAAQAPKSSAPAAAPAEQPLTGGSKIAAVVNGDVISEADINNRAKLFAISTGLPLSQEVIDRLRSQIRRQLVDERLRI